MPGDAAGPGGGPEGPGGPGGPGGPCGGGVCGDDDALPGGPAWGPGGPAGGPLLGLLPATWFPGPPGPPGPIMLGGGPWFMPGPPQPW